MPVLVYGFVEPGTKLRGLEGLDGRELRVVECDSVAALVSDLDGDVVVARRRTVRAFVEALSAAIDRSTVIPMQFGAVMGGDRDVHEELLEPLHDELRELLDRFENLVEMRVAARYDERRLLAEIVEASAEVRQLRGTKTQQLRLGELVARAYDRMCAQDTEALLARVRPLVEDEEHDELPEWGVMATSFLVRRVRLDAFESAVERWTHANAGRIGCELAGPMPPFSFVELQLPAAEAAWA
jgi:hypothetical protein